MAELYKVDSPITREQRNNLNLTFEDILRRLSNLRFQISLLSGGADLEAVIQRIEDAIASSNTATSNTEMKLTEVDSALANLEVAVQNANTATTGANDATTEVRQEILNIQSLISNLGNAETYDNAKQYYLNNVVELNGSSFMAIQDTLGNLPPTLPLKRNDYWQLLAQRGVDGAGSVSAINGVGPNVDGNVSLTPENIGAATQEQLQEITIPYEATIYVSNSGSDSNNGLTTGNPVLTIQRAVDIWKSNVEKAGTWTIKIASGTYDGAVIDQIRSDKTLTIEGELTNGQPSVIIDGANASYPSGLNFNSGVRAIVRYVDVRNFSNSGILFQNGSYGTIDTCNGSNNAFATFNANQYSNLDIIGNCNITLEAGQKGIRYYRQCTGSWSDPNTTITIDGQDNVTDGIEIRDNSYVVATDGVVVRNCQGFGVLLRRHSYIELRTGTLENNAVGIGLRDLSLFANASGVLTMTNNANNYTYQGFSLPFIGTNTYKNTVVGNTGPSIQNPTGSGYDLIVSSNASTGIQMLTDTTSPINIDFNKLGRITYGQTDNTIRFFQNNIEQFRMRTDAFIPLQDNQYSLGQTQFRFSNIYGASSTINTSDRNQKQQISEIPNEVLDAWSEVNFYKFKFNEAVDKKGEKARWHFGIIAQEIAEKFEKHNLNALDYGLLCYDEWEDVYEENEKGELELTLKAGSSWGVRHDECQFLELALMRRELKKLKEK